MRFVHPTAPELLLAVEQQLVELLDVLDEPWRYHARVAITAVATVRRELESETPAVDAERATLLDRVRASTDNDETLLADLLRSTGAVLAIANPSWLAQPDASAETSR